MANEIKRLYLLQIFQVASHGFGWSIIFYYFINILMISVMDILIYFLLGFLAVIPVVLLLKKLNLKKHMFLGIMIRISMFLIMVFFAGRSAVFLVGILFGVFLIFFWVPWNVRYFGYAKSRETAFLSSSFFVLFPLSGAVFPYFAGMVADTYGFRAVFLAGAFLASVSAVLIMTLKNKEIVKTDWRRAWAMTKKVKTLMFLHGLFQGTQWAVVTIVTLFFVKSAMEYGMFLSYFGLIGAFAAILMGRLSDRMGNRTYFIYPAAVLASVFMILAGFSTTVFQWAAFVGLMSFFFNIVNPFAATIVTDVSTDMASSFSNRELMLNLGRSAGVVTAMSALTFLGDMKYALVISGVIFALFPIVLKRKKLYDQHAE